jgi:O-antigen chain-terminating methyltransferase
MANIERFSIDDVLAKVRNLRAAESPPPNAVQGELSARHIGSHANIPLVPLPAEPRLDPERDNYTVGEFLALPQNAFIDEAYRLVLGREPDTGGRTHYLELLNRGQATRVSILMGMRLSAEGRKHAVRLKRLLPSYALYRLTTLPLVGRFFAPLVAVINLPGTLARLNARLETNEHHHRQTIMAINEALLATRRGLVELGVASVENARRHADVQREAEANARDIERVGTSTLDEMRAMREQALGQTHRIAELVDAAKQALVNRPDLVGSLDGVAAHQLDDLYVAFENQFRGPQKDVAAKATRYLPLFQHNQAVAAGGIVLDIGCGRGEWMKILSTHNIASRGIDLNETMVGICRQDGLDAHSGDAVAYMKGLAPGSLAAITGFHIVEHLRFEQLVEMLDAARQALAPGGLILFETPNPENLVVGACTFNNDPTHNKPIPPEVMRFLATARGFEQPRIIRMEADIDLEQPESGFDPKEVNDWFRLPMDYALYAQKRLEG